MTIKIYDFANKEREIKIPARNADEILTVFVNIKSGDETGLIILKNGETITFDAGSHRICGFDDGCYVVRNNEIKKWLNFKPTGNRTASYERQKMFY